MFLSLPHLISPALGWVLPGLCLLGVYICVHVYVHVYVYVCIRACWGGVYVCAYECVYVCMQAFFLKLLSSLLPLSPCDFVFGSLTVSQVFIRSWLCPPISLSLPSHTNQFHETGGNPEPFNLPPPFTPPRAWQSPPGPPTWPCSWELKAEPTLHYCSPSSGAPTAHMGT